LRSRPRPAPTGDVYDNALAEAWLASFKSELVDGRRFPSFEHAEHEVLKHSVTCRPPNTRK
jgi:hypothetical protein